MFVIFALSFIGCNYLLLVGTTVNSIVVSNQNQEPAPASPTVLPVVYDDDNRISITYGQNRNANYIYTPVLNRAALGDGIISASITAGQVSIPAENLFYTSLGEQNAFSILTNADTPGVPRLVVSNLTPVMHEHKLTLRAGYMVGGSSATNYINVDVFLVVLPQNIVDGPLRTSLHNAILDFSDNRITRQVATTETTTTLYFSILEAQIANIYPIVAPIRSRGLSLNNDFEVAISYYTDIDIDFNTDNLTAQIPLPGPPIDPTIEYPSRIINMNINGKNNFTGLTSSSATLSFSPNGAPATSLTELRYLDSNNNRISRLTFSLGRSESFDNYFLPEVTPVAAINSVSFRLSSGLLLPGLSLDPSTGRIYGPVIQIGRELIALEATASGGFSGSTTFSANLASSGNMNFGVDSSGSSEVVFNGRSLGLTINQNYFFFTGSFSGTPPDSFTGTVTGQPTMAFPVSRGSGSATLETIDNLLRNDPCTATPSCTFDPRPDGSVANDVAVEFGGNDFVLYTYTTAIDQNPATEDVVNGVGLVANPTTDNTTIPSNHVSVLLIDPDLFDGAGSYNISISGVNEIGTDAATESDSQNVLAIFSGDFPEGDVTPTATIEQAYSYSTIVASDSIATDITLSDNQGLGLILYSDGVRGVSISDITLTKN